MEQILPTTLQYPFQDTWLENTARQPFSLDLALISFGSKHDNPKMSEEVSTRLIVFGIN
jgi:hypothetical protein